MYIFPTPDSSRVSITAMDLAQGGFKWPPSLLVIRNCACDTPHPLCSAFLSQVYLGSAQRRERNPAGRGDWVQEWGCFFFSLAVFLQGDGQLS